MLPSLALSCPQWQQILVNSWQYFELTICTFRSLKKEWIQTWGHLYEEKNTVWQPEPSSLNITGRLVLVQLNRGGPSCLSTLQLPAPAATDGAVLMLGQKPGTISSFHCGGRQDKCVAVFPTHLPLLLPRLLFILMRSGRSSWWWHWVDYAVPTVTYSKAAMEGAIVASDLWMTAPPVAPVPHWQWSRACMLGRAHQCQYLDFWHECGD